MLVLKAFEKQIVELLIYVVSSEEVFCSVPLKGR
jgi:hypothetical protein